MKNTEALWLRNSEMFTNDEKTILKLLPIHFKWIARDEDGTLWVYEDKPKRGDGAFIANDTPSDCAMMKTFNLFNHIFKTVTWDSSPIEFRVEVLDDAEREYLKAVFKPFRGRIVFVEKMYDSLERQYIEAELDNCDTISFPYFEAETMYKGMEVGKEYSLSELGIKYD